MEVNILHLYPDCMSLYGEWANAAVLARQLENLGAKVTVRRLLLDETPDFSDADFIYMGAGTERTQKAALMALKDHAGALRAALDRGAGALFTGSAMEILGKSVTDARGREWPGLGLADYTSTETDRREPEDVIAHTDLLDTPVVGFMNKCSTTSGVTAPLFSHLTLGFGNDRPCGSEGYAAGGLLATHLTGPILVKNPDLLALVVRRLFRAKGQPLPETIPPLPHQREAYDVTLRELSARAGTN